MKYTLKIQPAILPEQRHKIQDILTQMGFDVHGGGTDIDMSCCDISFSSDGELPDENVACDCFCHRADDCPEYNSGDCMLKSNGGKGKNDGNTH